MCCWRQSPDGWIAAQQQRIPRDRRHDPPASKLLSIPAILDRRVNEAGGAHAPPDKYGGDGMNMFLWVLQVLLALAFFAHGCLLLFPPAAVFYQMNAAMPRWFQLFLGIAEVLAAVGLTLPGAARIQPWLVSGAAAGIMIVMISATIFHVMRGEVSSAITTFVLLVMATYVAYMRWRVAPIRPRSAV
jgi:putative oxidoreductase